MARGRRKGELPKELQSYRWGDCGAFAFALLAERPDLQLGIAWEYIDLEHPEYGSVLEEEVGLYRHSDHYLRLQHIFAHDQEYVYDAEGKQTTKDFCSHSRYRSIDSAPTYWEFSFGLGEEEVLATGFVDQEKIAKAQKILQADSSRW